MNETKKYLDYNGLETLVNIIKGTYAEKTDLSLVSQVATNAAQAATTLESSKQDKLIAGSNIQIAEDGKTISATDKTKLDGVATGAQANTIETVKVNSSALTPDNNKAIDIKVPTVLSELADDIGLVNKSNFENEIENVRAEIALKLDASLKGTANGVAELDANGKVLTSQLPSFVDDVIEAENFAVLPNEGETGKIYVTLDDNKTYRWSGSAYVEISASLALGETDSTAYRGDRGKIAYDHATDANKISSAITSGMYKVAGTADGHIASLTAMTGSDIEGLMTFATNSEIDALFN